MHQKGVKLNQIIGSIEEKYKLAGDIDNIGEILLYPAFIGDAKNNSITYCPSNLRNQLELIGKCKAKAIFCSNSLVIPENTITNKVLIFVSNPKLSFVKMMQSHYQDGINFGTHPTAVIEKDARIHPNVYIGPHCYIGKCQIGEGTIIYGNTYIYSGVKIGKRVVINAGTVIGAEGMEFTNNEMGQFERYPHVGRVNIEDDVWIGANVSIMRGVLNDTNIGYGTKLGPFCSIGHQAVIGEHCLIITRSVIGGSCRVGDHTRISLGACIRDGINIGSNVNIGMGSVVTKDIADRWIAYGIPAKEIRRVPESEIRSNEN
jgi:UDP-3-O-[3-hydroxymyristoyl] glucosamine N-acyltransferase